MIRSNLSKADLHLLHVFIVVVDSNGLSAAQAALNVSTSTISRQISDLEIRLGMRLCQRGMAGFSVTDKGEIVYRAAKDLFAAVDEFTNTINGTQGKLIGQLSIGLIDNWVVNDKAPIVTAISTLTKVSPDVSLDLHSLAPGDIEFAVFNSSVSIGIGVFHVHKPGLNYEEIAQENMGLYCAQGHPYFNDTQDQACSINLENSLLASRAYLNEEKVAPMTKGLKSNANAHQIEGIAILILTGNYIGYLPESYAKLWVKSGRMKSVAGGKFDIPTSIKLVTKAGRKLTLVEKYFVELLCAEASLS